MDIRGGALTVQLGKRRRATGAQTGKQLFIEPRRLGDGDNTTHLWD